MLFSQKTFLSLTREHQHRKCAQLLKDIWELYPLHFHLSHHYEELCSWALIPPLAHFSRESIANRYHEHLKNGGLSLKEHNLLPRIEIGDHSREEISYMPIVIYLDHIRSAHNVGSIVRTNEALRLGSLYFSEQTPNINHPQVITTSMGCSLLTKITPDVHENLPRPWIALETATPSLSLNEFLFPQEFTLILGNEEYGISEKMLKESDYCLKIPLYGQKNSLNVANAFSMAAYEISRQLRK